jgi:P4 family phage/plasmid primase-like protien
MTKKAPALQFLPATRCARNTAFTLTAAEFCARAAAEGMRPGFTWNERFTGGTEVKPYFDQDRKYDAEPGEERLRADEEELRRTVRRVFPDAREDEIVLAQRHGFWTDPKSGSKKFKSSVRAWVLNRKIRAGDIPALVRARFHPDPVPDSLDLTVFKEAEQLLGCVMACKDSDDPKRYLTPRDPSLPLHCYLAQHLEDGAVAVSVPTPGAGNVVTKVTKKRGRPRKNKEVVSSGGPSGTSKAGGGDVETEEGGTGNKETLSGPDYAAALKDASDCFGREYRMQEALTSIIVDPERGCFVFPTREKWCIIRGGKHAGNNPYVILNNNGATFRCLDEECKAKGEGKLIPFRDLPESLRDLFNRRMYGDQVADELMEEAKQEARGNIMTNFRREDETALVPIQDRDSLITTLQVHPCPVCDRKMLSVEHRGCGWVARCKGCDAVWPDAPVPLVAEKYPKLTQALNQLTVINVVNNVNNVTNVTHIHQAADGAALDFHADFTSDALELFKDREENRLFVESLIGTDMRLSTFAVHHFRDRFHCTINDKWYEYRGHCWHEGAANVTFKEALGRNEFLRPFREVALHFESLPIQTDEVKRKAKAVRKLCMSLEDGKFRERIVADSIAKFHERRPEFESRCNSDNIMVFSSGVYNFDTMEFGPGSPDTPVTMYVDQPYLPYDPANEDCQFLLRFVHDILPDPMVADYTLKVLALALTTDISQQYLWILSGSGGNGKSLLMRLIEECLGPYFQSMNPTFLTRPREEASGANEALMAMIKTRLVVFQEPEARDVIQAGLVKAITGGDTLTSRSNYGKQKKFRPTWKSFMVTNDIPMISETTTDAIWRRIRVILFAVKFVDDPDPANPFEKKRDERLDAKLTKASPYFISILIQYLRKYKAEGLRLPEEIEEATRKYQSDTDMVKAFIEEHMIRDETCTVKWPEVRRAFAQANRGRKIPGVEALRAEFTKNGMRYVESLPLTEHWAADKHFRGFMGWRLADRRG